MLPEYLMPHSLILVRPATATDAYGNTTYDYPGGTRTAFRGWIQQDKRDEVRSEGRAALEQRWLLLTNDSILGHDRVEHGAIVYEVEGPPETAYTPASAHHTEATLRVVSG